MKLFNSLHDGFFAHKSSHIYNGIISSYMKVQQLCHTISSAAPMPGKLMQFWHARCTR